MSAITVIGMKKTKDPYNTKVVYEAMDGKLYIRTGKDGFSKGAPLSCSESSLFTKWGYCRVENEPTFKDPSEIVDNIARFELKADGNVVYSE